MGISQQPESIQTWAMDILESMLTFHEFWPPGSMPRGGAGGRNLGHPKKCYTAFSFMLTPSSDIRSDISHPYDPSFRVMR